MYGKAYERMYRGSMCGAGEHIFVVWNYAIACAFDSRVELNPAYLAKIIGSTEERMGEAIKYLSSPDVKSTHKEHGGRRLVREGEYQYFMPSWATYHAIKNEEALRESNRVRQARYRAKKAGKELPGEVAAMSAEACGDQQGADAIAAEALPAEGVADDYGDLNPDAG